MHDKNAPIYEYTPFYGRLGSVFRRYIDELVKQSAMLLWPE